MDLIVVLCLDTRRAPLLLPLLVEAHLLQAAGLLVDGGAGVPVDRLKGCEQVSLTYIIRNWEEREG